MFRPLFRHQGVHLLVKTVETITFDYDAVVGYIENIL